jgi:hypothetical protein
MQEMKRWSKKKNPSNNKSVIKKYKQGVWINKIMEQNKIHIDVS